MDGPHDDIFAAFNARFLDQMKSLFPEPDPRMRITSPYKERQITLNQMLNCCAVNDETGCWEWQGASTTKGYGRVKLSRKLYSPHRVVAWAMGIAPAMGDPSRKTVVMHSCDNPRCCNPGHLSLGTHSENMTDCARKGRMANQKNPWRPKQAKDAKVALKEDPKIMRTKSGKWILTPKI